MGELRQLSLGDQDSRRLLADGRYELQRLNFRADSYDAAYLDLDHNWGYFPSVSIMAYWLNGRLYQGTYPSSTLANPKLRWERSKQMDLGLDLRFFKGRLTTTIDYYHKLTDGLLIQSVAPLTTGASTVYQNLGKVTNSGVEIELDWKDNIGDFSYGVKANLATVSNKVKEYRGEDTRLEGSGMLGASSKMTYFEEGYPLWYIRGYKYEGVNQQTGEPIFADLDGNGEITDADRTELGKGIPDFTYGMTLTRQLLYLYRLSRQRS